MKRSGFIDHALRIAHTLQDYLTTTALEAMPAENANNVKRCMNVFIYALEDARSAQLRAEAKEMRP